MTNQKISTDISKLKGGDDHYMAYVGPPTQYDFMGATQFRLLCTLGLRANHNLLDFGCGSLRGGRFFISYLEEGNYFGIEPNQWLIEEAITNQVGQDLIRIKNPRFDYNDKFQTDIFSTQFDFILAQSIFSHTGADLIVPALKNFSESLKDTGLIVITLVEGLSVSHPKGWIYPGVVTFPPSTIKKFAQEANLFETRIPWYHPRQTWYLFAKDQKYLPTKAMLKFLTGAVLFQPEFAESWNQSHEIMSIRKSLKTSAILFAKRILRRK